MVNIYLIIKKRNMLKRIQIESHEISGKTTQASLLCQYFSSKGMASTTIVEDENGLTEAIPPGKILESHVIYITNGLLNIDCDIIIHLRGRVPDSPNRQFLVNSERVRNMHNEFDISLSQNKEFTVDIVGKSIEDVHREILSNL